MRVIITLSKHAIASYEKLRQLVHFVQCYNRIGRKLRPHFSLLGYLCRNFEYRYSPAKRHSIFRKVNRLGFAAKYSECLATVCALDYRKNIHRLHNVCRLVVLHKPARLVDSLVFPSEPFFAHEFESEYDMSLRVNAEHIHDYLASFHLVLRHVKYVACPRFGFNCQKDACIIIHRYNVRKPGAATAKPARLPILVIQALNNRMFIAVASAAPDVSQAE